MNAREAAFTALEAYRKNGAWSDVFLGTLAQKEKMDRRDAALAYRITCGVLQNMTLCDWYISCFSTVKTGKMEAAVLAILRLSVYQLVFMDRIPPSAAVNEGVRLASKHCKRASGFVNAVLRKIAANRCDLPEPPKGDDASYLSIKYSHPEWLVKRFLSRLGAEQTEKLLECGNHIPPVYAQVNTLKTGVPELLQSLDGDNCAYRAHSWLDGCFELENTGGVERLSAFQNGLFQLQDPAARLAAMAASPREGTNILDACAAPGGKSFASAMLMHNRGSIVSCDIYPRKVEEIKNGADRLGVEIITARQADAAVFNEAFADRFDTVIADVPCSGMGVIRKKPEIRYKKEKDVSELPKLQRRILQNVSRYVRPGGTLVYSTCTLLESENEEVVRDFLLKNSNFSAESFRLPGIAGAADSGMITLWPHIHGTDGFFICRMHRSE